MTNQGDQYSTYTAPAGTVGAAASSFVLPGLSIIGGLYDSHQNRKVARENTDKTIAAQKAEAELQYQRAVEMWNMQNQYNTPQAQMARFKEAGLNPHLIYGQGNSGNATAPPSYQAPHLQYKYAAGNYGQVISSVLPMLMQVGTWLQDMRLSETRISQGETSIDKMEQMIEYLREANPKLLEKLANQVDITRYSADTSKVGVSKAQVGLMDLIEKFNYDWGSSPTGMTYHGYKGQGAREGSAKSAALQKLYEDLRIRGYEGDIKEAQASWTDYDITNPQAIIQMVLGAALSMAGMGVRNISKPKAPAPKVNRKLSRTITNTEYGKRGSRTVRRNIYE